MFDFFGPNIPQAAKFFIAFLVVLALIGIVAWLVRRFGSSRLGGASRGRQPRLAVIDAATVDGRRRLVLIRRDNVEHLLMIGGPTDVVVEPNIVRAAAAREAAPVREVAPLRETAPARTLEPAVRVTPPVETAWPLQPLNDLPPAPAAPSPRALRSSATEEPWLPPEPGARPRPVDSLSGLANELAAKRPAPEIAAPPPRLEPTPPPPAFEPAPAPAAQNDQNLAEMAQQLEAALRRTPAPEGRPPVTDALAVPPPPKSADVARPPLRDFKPRTEPKADMAKAEAKPEPKFEMNSDFAPPEPKAEPKLSAKPEAKPLSGKALFDNLEEEMASLLGRPSGKS